MNNSLVILVLNILLEVSEALATANDYMKKKCLSSQGLFFMPGDVSLGRVSFIISRHRSGIDIPHQVVLPHNPIGVDGLFARHRLVLYVIYLASCLTQFK